MLKWGIGAAAAALTMPLAAGQADAQAWYGTLSATYSDVDSANTVISNRLPTGDLNASVNPEAGFGVRGAVGMDTGSMIRVEGEFGFTRNDLESYRPRGTTGAMPMTGHINTTSVMGNAYVDFKLAGASIVPFIGVGVGGANIDIDETAALPNAPTGPQVNMINEANTHLAWQAMAGIGLPVGDRVALTLQYRYFSAGTINGNDTTGRAYQTDISAGDVDLGLRIKF